MSVSDLVEDVAEILNEGPGKKMVFGKVVDVGRKKFKAKAHKSRMRKRDRAKPSRVIGKGFKKETQRQIDHSVSRGVRKVRGSKTEEMYDLLGEDSLTERANPGSLVSQAQKILRSLPPLRKIEKQLLAMTAGAHSSIHGINVQRKEDQGWLIGKDEFQHAWQDTGAETLQGLLFLRELKIKRDSVRGWPKKIT